MKVGVLGGRGRVGVRIERKSRKESIGRRMVGDTVLHFFAFLRTVQIVMHRASKLKLTI